MVCPVILEDGVDTILMRVVDVVICIPAMPLYIIIGSVMDYYKIDPRIRIMHFVQFLVS